MSSFSLIGETSSSSTSDLSRGPASLHKPDPRSCLPGDALHYAVWHGKNSDIKRFVTDGGVSIETHNCHGQTPLFVAAYSQNYFTVKALLQLGADPNGRCIAGYTPTHAACYSGSRKILSKILEAGGDLRLHDENQCTPIDWALWQSDGEKKLRIMELIDSARRCTMKQSGKDALAEKQFSRNIGGRASLSTLFKRKLPVKGGKNGKQEVDMGELVKSIHAMGFGKMYFGNGMKAAAISTIPYIDAADLCPDRHHPSYASGSFTEMSSKLWLHTRVTVRSLLEPPPSGAIVDILISELEALCKLTHPQILLLMGVCQTKNYEGLMLVFEHVQLGSLYYCLHEKNCMPKIKSAVDIILQIVDALIYLHSHGWLHCSLTSHAVHLVGPSVAKLSSFELAVEDKEETRRNRTLDLLADKGWQSIYNWLCPDILRGEPPSKIGDLYSLCCLIWEICTGQVPWGNLDPDEILIEIKLKGHSLPLDKKYIPKHLLTVLEQGLKLRRDERDVSLHEIRDMLILTRKNAVKNEKKELPPRASGAYSHRNSSTTDSGVWFGSGSQPVRSYSSSAIQRSPVSSHSSQSCHHSAAEDEEDIKSSKDVDEFTGLRKTSSILKRKKYDKTFGKFPSKIFSASHQNVVDSSNDFDYVSNRAKRDFLRHGCVSREAYVTEAEEDLRRRSLSSLYHATLCASEKDNGIDLLSSSEEHSSCDLSPYVSGDSLSGEPLGEKRRSPKSLRSRSVPRTHSSTIPLSNTAAEFVAAHLQEANKRGYGRTFSNLSQKSRENLEDNIEHQQQPLPPFRKSPPRQNNASTKGGSNHNDIKPASHAIQRCSPDTTTSKRNSNNNRPPPSKPVHKKDLVSSMSKLNLQLPVQGSKSTAIIHKNKSASALRSPLGAFKEAYQSRSKAEGGVSKSKSLASLPKFTSVGGSASRLSPAKDLASRLRPSPPKDLASRLRPSPAKDDAKRVTLLSKRRTQEDAPADSKKDQNSVLIRPGLKEHKSLSSGLRVVSSHSSNSDRGLIQHSSSWRKARNLTDKRSISVGSIKSTWESRAASSKEDEVLRKKTGGESNRRSAIGGFAGKYPPPRRSSFGKKEPLLIEEKVENKKKQPYTLESNILGSASERFTVQKVRPSILKPLNRKGPNPRSVIYSNTRQQSFKSHYASVSDRKPFGSDIVRSGDRVSSPPRSQWSTKGVQNLIQSLESIQQQKVQNVSLYQTAPSESAFLSSPNVIDEENPKPNDLSAVPPALDNNNEVRSNEDNLAYDNFNNIIPAVETHQMEDPWNNNNFYEPAAPPMESTHEEKPPEEYPPQMNEWNNVVVQQQDPFFTEAQEVPACDQWGGGFDAPTTTEYAQEPEMNPYQEQQQWDNGGNCYPPPSSEFPAADPFSNNAQGNDEANMGGLNNDPFGQNNMINNNYEEETPNPWITAPDEVETPNLNTGFEDNQNNPWGGNDANLTQLDATEVNNNNEQQHPPSQEAAPPLILSASTPVQSPIVNSKDTSPKQQKSKAFALRTSTPNDYKSHQVHRTLQSAYSTAMAKALEEDESEESSECWNTADGGDEILNLQEEEEDSSVIRSSAMVIQMDKKLSRRKSSQKQQGHRQDIEAKQNNVTFNSEVLEISNSVSAYTQTPNAEMLSSRRASASSSFMSQEEDTEDLYCDDELNPSLENDPNMQLTISRLQEAAAAANEEEGEYPSNPMFNDQDSILSMDIPSTGPTSLRSELSEDKDNYNTASSEDDDEEDNSVSVRSATPTNSSINKYSDGAQ